MTTPEFMKACEDYFGRWQRITVKAAVSQFMQARNDYYRDELWILLRNGRTVAYGPPDVKAITDLHVEVCDALDIRMMKNPPSALLTDGDDTLCTPGERKAFWESIAEKFHEKWEADKKAHNDAPPRYTRKEKAFPYLDGIRGDETVTILADFYDETISMEDRMKHYSAARAAIAARKKR